MVLFSLPAWRFPEDLLPITSPATTRGLRRHPQYPFLPTTSRTHSHINDDPQKSRSSANHCSLPQLHGCDHHLQWTKMDSNQWWRETQNAVSDRVKLGGLFGLKQKFSPLDWRIQTEALWFKSLSNPQPYTPSRSSDALVKEHPRRLHSPPEDLSPSLVPVRQTQAPNPCLNQFQRAVPEPNGNLSATTEQPSFSAATTNIQTGSYYPKSNQGH